MATGIWVNIGSGNACCLMAPSFTWTNVDCSSVESNDIVAASWSSGRVQDSGLGSRSSPGFNTLPVQLLVVPLSKALHAALLLSTQEEMGTCEGRFVSRGAKLRVSGCILPRELRWISRRIWTVKGPMTREGTCQSLQSRALSLDVDSKQWLFTYILGQFHEIPQPSITKIRLEITYLKLHSNSPRSQWVKPVFL